MPNWKKVIVSGSNAVLNNITASGHVNILDNGFTVEPAATTELEVQGNISASGNLFALLSNANGSHNNTVMYNTTTGRFYYTGSYGGGGSGDPGDPGTTVIANDGAGGAGDLTSISIGGESFNIPTGDDDWSTNIANLVYTDNKSVAIGGHSTAEYALRVDSNNNTSGTTIFSIVSQADEEVFSVTEPSGDSAVFTVNDSSGLPILSVESNGDITMDGSIIMGNTTGHLNLINDNLNSIVAAGNVRGETVRFGNSDTNPAALYYWDGDSWEQASDSIVAARGALLAIALGDNSTDDGMLLRGVAHIEESVVAGGQVYVGSSPGTVTTTATTTNGRCLRSIGHSIEADVIYFNPSPDFIVVSA